MTPREWHDDIAAWPASTVRAARAAGIAFVTLLAAVPLLRLAVPPPPAPAAPIPDWSWDKLWRGETLKQLERHYLETSWLTVPLRALYDELPRWTGWRRAEGLLGRFHYQTAAGEVILPEKIGADAFARGFVAMVPGTVGRELPRPRVMIAPNQSFWLCYHDNDLLRREWFDEQGRVLVRINALGMRERPEVVGPKQPGDERVLCLGDSMTFGWGVPEELAWVRVVENELRSERPRLRTLNAGAAGMVCVDEYAAALVHRFASLQPDAVVVGLCLNDLIPSSGLSFEVPPKAALGFGERLRGGVPPSPLDLDPARDWVGELLALPGDQAIAGGLCNDDKPFEAMWSQGTPQRSLRAIKAWCDERNVPMLIVLWPFLQGLGPARSYPFEKLHQLVAADCAAAGIPLFDVLPLLRDTPQEEWWVSPADMHPNPNANAIAGRAIAAALRAVWPR